MTDPQTTTVDPAPLHGPLARRLAEAVAAGDAVGLREELEAAGEVGIAGMDARLDASGELLRVDAGAETETVRYASFLGLAEEVIERRAGGEPFHLFRADPVSWRPTAADQRLARDLERSAWELDALAPQSPPDDPAIAAKRRFLLAELRDAGIHDARGAATRERVLGELGCEILLTYLRASTELRTYVTGPERAAAGIDASPPRVSLDWFRLAPQAAPPLSPHAWLARCESAVVRGGDDGAYLGSIFLKVGEDWFTLWWRRDDARTPVLLSATPGRSASFYDEQPFMPPGWR